MLLTFDVEWAELPDDIAQPKQQAWQEWEDTNAQLDDPTQPLPPQELAQLERRQRTAWKQSWHPQPAGPGDQAVGTWYAASRCGIVRSGAVRGPWDANGTQPRRCHR
jgi:hypothetical protein